MRSHVAGVELAIKPSIGIAIYPQHGATGEQLISNADKAMYRAKKQARGIVFGDLQVAGEIAVG